MMTSRQRVETTLNHRQSDRTPLDLSASAVTGMHVSTVYQLRQALKLDPPGRPEQVRDEVRRRIQAFGSNGGFVFNPIHNVQARTPAENVLAMYEALREYQPKRYPL